MAHLSHCGSLTSGLQRNEVVLWSLIFIFPTQLHGPSEKKSFMIARLQSVMRKQALVGMAVGKFAFPGQLTRVWGSEGHELLLPSVFLQLEFFIYQEPCPPASKSREEKDLRERKIIPYLWIFFSFLIIKGISLQGFLRQLQDSRVSCKHMTSLKHLNKVLNWFNHLHHPYDLSNTFSFRTCFETVSRNSKV